MSIILDNLTKHFGTLLVVDDLSLEIADGELFVLLGGSGSGKSTILRMIAGLTIPDSGQVLLHGRDVTMLPPQQRGVGFVFQNYSIFRHMSVAENIEFGLKIRGVPTPERALRRDELLDLVGLAGLGQRYSDQLSGGQRQRVALARALAYEPSVLLLDEPFGALDVKIRVQLRRSLQEIQRRLGVTTILVTHDQEEAFELGDRIGVMERGHLLEVGEPETLYRHPRSSFVATFLGAGTVLAGRVRAGEACFGAMRLPLPPTGFDEGDTVQVLFRPEYVQLSVEQPVDRPLLGQGHFIEQSFAGAHRKVRLRLPRLAATRQVAPVLPFGEEGLLVDALLSGEEPLPGTHLWVSLKTWYMLERPQPRLLLYAREAGQSAAVGATHHLAGAFGAVTTVVEIAESADLAATRRVALEQRLREQRLSAEVRVRVGEPAEQLLAEQVESLAELLIVGSEPDGGLDDTLTRLLDHSYSPVLVTRGTGQRWERVLICTAAGEPGKSDVRFGGRLARRLGMAATLLYVTHDATLLTKEMEGHLERGAATLRALDVRVACKVREARTATEGILAEASEGYDLIVVGSHGPQSRSLFALDDVTLQVVARATCPVLVVPAEG